MEFDEELAKFLQVRGLARSADHAQSYASSFLRSLPSFCLMISPLILILVTMNCINRGLFFGHKTTLFFFLLIAAMACQPKEAVETSDEEEEPKITVPKGFTLDELYRPTDRNMGTWVSLSEGPNGKMYACDQHGDLYKFKIPAIGEVLDSTQVDSVDLDIGFAHGLMWAFNSLYVSVNRRWNDEMKTGSGIYRLTDEDGDGNLDQVKQLLKLDGAGEHGPHSFILGPNEGEIYFIAGNHTTIPDEVLGTSRISTRWQEDNLLKPYKDARGHATKIKAPGGWVAKTDSLGQSWELVSVGYRNAFDFAFNEQDELFVFDADMEWDFGMPWYRPIRICHATSGSEFGWRTGTGKWPTYYPDALPSVVDLGQGSPTGVLFGETLNFPAKYKRGLFVNDWSFGTMYFVDLKEDGSSYVGSKEQFIYGVPFPLTDMIAGSDGHMYFAVGGRKLASRFYRLRYTGSALTEVPANESASEEAELRTLRRSLENLHEEAKPGGVTLAWSNLDHEDRFVRYAARVALEHQDVGRWKNQVLIEKDPQKFIPSSIALTRMAEPSADLQLNILNKLNDINLDELSIPSQLDMMRSYELSLSRMGKPRPSVARRIGEKLHTIFPNEDNAINREVAEILIFLSDEKATSKCIDLMTMHTDSKTVTQVEMLADEVSSRHERYGKDVKAVIANMPPAEAIFYAVALSHADAGWTKELHEKYFQWFYDVFGANGGLSFKAFMENVRLQALLQIPEDEKNYFEELSGVYSPAEEMANLPQPEGPGGVYNIYDINHMIGDPLKEYVGNIEDGERIFNAALCGSCHRMHGEGGISGPDLSQINTRFDRGDMVQALFSPSEEISDQYAFTLLTLKDGRKVAGKIFSEEDGKIILMPNPYTSTLKVEYASLDVAERGMSPVSPMPPGLLNRLNEKEMVDLFAYLLSGGDEEHHYYGGEKGKEESD